MARKLKYNFLSLPSLAGHDDYQSTPGTPDLTITRATKATDTGADGYIHEYAAGEARFTGATFNHNFEPYSNTFSDSEWTKLNCTVAQDATDYAGNANTAWTVSGDGLGATEVVGPRGAAKGLPLDNHGIYVAADMKAVDGTWAMAYSIGGAQCWFNLVTGVQGTVEAGVLGSGMRALGNGWYRCWVVSEANVDDIRPYFLVTGADNSTAGIDNSSVVDWFLISRAHSAVVPLTGSYAELDYIETEATAVSTSSGTSTKGLLVESARTNICLQSEDFSTTWISDATTPTAGAGIAPDGSNTATDVIHTGTGELKQTMTVVADTVYTFSVFIHSGTTGTHDWIKLRYRDSGAANGIDAWFDLTSSAAVGTSQTFGAGTTLTGTHTEDLGNGWYRIGLTGQLASGITGGRVEVYNTTADAGETREQTNSTWVWGAVLEAGAFPTSYIATEATSVTRNADNVTSTDLAWYDQSRGTMFANATTFGYGDIINQLFAITTGSNVDSRYIANGSSDNRSSAFKRIGFATAINIFRSSLYDPSTQARVRTAHGFDDSDGDHFLYANGIRSSLDKNDTQALDPADAFWIGCNTSAAHWNGHIAEIAYWDERFSTPILQEMSLGNFSNTEDQVFIRKKARDRFRRRYRRT